MKRILYLVLMTGCLAFAGCRGGSEECPYEKKQDKQAAKAAAADLNWCRVCVRSKSGYFSCQRASGSEKRDTLLKKARDLACRDAQWPDDNCPDEAVFMSRCKGDPGPETNKDMKIKPVPVRKILPEGIPKEKLSPSSAQASPASTDIKAEPDKTSPAAGQ